MITYTYEIKGAGSNGQTWAVKDETVVSGAGAFLEAVDHAMRDAFIALTQGKATYGQPGKTCSGPYRITSLVLTEKVPETIG